MPYGYKIIKVSWDFWKLSNEIWKHVFSNYKSDLNSKF